MTLPELQLIATTTDESAGACGCGGCGCGGAEADGAGVAAGAAGGAQARAGEAGAEDLDVRRLLPPQRHARILEAVAALEPGEAFVLANDHDPKPLRYQLDAEEPGQIEWTYLAEGPELWRVRIARVAGHCC